MFYNRLFEVAPAVRPMFKTPVNEQSVKLMSMLGMIVSHLDKLDVISKQVGDLAQRHNAYGAKPEHYAVVGDCLLWTLEKGLGDDFNKATRLAWQSAFEALAGIMIEAQRQSAVA